MTCLVVTAGGYGDVFKFRILKEAAEHPLCQYGDPVLMSGMDIDKFWGRGQLVELHRFLGDTPQDTSARDALTKVAAGGLKERHARDLLEGARVALLEGVLRAAKEPPTDPAVICQLVRENRSKHQRISDEIAKTRTRTMTEETTATTTETAAAKPGKSKYAGNLLVTVLVHTNPKRAGSKSFDRFAKYVTGQTVDDALKAGVLSADLHYDVDHKFIHIGETVVEVPPAPEPAAAPAAEPAAADGATTA